MRTAPVSTAKNAPKTTRPRRRRLPRRTAARLRLLRWRAKVWKRQARRAATLALVGVMAAQAPLTTYAQFGQAPMGQPQGLANGIVNNGLARLGELNNSGPGFMYYGVNGADRGLGYIGSYMTLGGFIPYAQDDLGGFWSADLRGHLSVNGGFFSNVGVVRKQLLGSGSLLGVGVYWDYDGDLYQYAGEGNSSFGQFGHVYNQVGVSGELLTDWGDIRSNGYMPVGTTAYTIGGPGTPFYQNMLLCQYGLDAALGGADLEVGAYIPALADWAGMISVGGYTLGNTFNKWQVGSRDGKAIVPWFGGVYTRIDVTIANNWDFSLQYNNDSFFDSTGFARLTYRLGGSRRRNVPDQLEQPMMRNEHIVRAHQTPELAYNNTTGSAWNFVHVDNTAASGGNGTFERPYNSLPEAQQDSLVQNQEWTVVYVAEGNSTSVSGAPYGGTFAFQQPNQFLIGSGGNFVLEVQPECGVNGLLTVPAQSSEAPVLSNLSGPSVEIGNSSHTGGSDTGGATIANLTITGSQTGIRAYGDLSGSPQPQGTTNNPFGTNTAGGTAVRNVTIAGDGEAAPQRGIWIASTDTSSQLPTGAIEFTDVIVGNMNNTGFFVGGLSHIGGNADIDFSGTITSDTLFNGGVASPILTIANTTGGTINIASSGAPAGTVVPDSIFDNGGEGILITNNSNSSKINIGSVTLNNSVSSAIAVVGDAATINIETEPDLTLGYGINKPTPGAAIVVSGGAPTLDFFGTINNSGSLGSSVGYLAQIVGVDGGDVTISGPGLAALRDTGDGVFISNTGATLTTEISLSNLELLSTGSTGININGVGSGSTIAINSALVGGGPSLAAGPSGTGVAVSNVDGASKVTFSNLDIDLTGSTATGLRIGNISSGSISLQGASTISTASTTAPAISVNDADQIILRATSVESGTPAGSGLAIVIDDTFAPPGPSAGTIQITSSFTVDTAGTPTIGTGTDVTNNSGGVTVSLGGAVISP